MTVMNHDKDTIITDNGVFMLDHEWNIDSKYGEFGYVTISFSDKAGSKYDMRTRYFKYKEDNRKEEYDFVLMEFKKEFKKLFNSLKENGSYEF